MSFSNDDYLGSPSRLNPIRDDNGELIPHVFTFGSILNTVSKTYSYRYDEAIRHNPENALAMRRDCYIDALLQERSSPTVNREWNIKCEDERDPVQKACASHLRGIVKHTPKFKGLIDYLNMEGAWYGRYGSQVVWKQRKVMGIPRWCIVKHKPVNGDKIQGAWDDTPAVLINPNMKDKFGDSIVFGDRNPMLMLNKRKWREQFIIHRYRLRDADYFEGEMAGVVQGEGLRSKVYWAWWLRDEMLSWCVDFMKKVGTLGLLIFPYEMSNPSSRAAAEENAKTASSKVAMTMPIYVDAMRGGEQLRPIHIPASAYGIEALQHMIADYFERHIERLIVGQSMSAGGGGSGGLEGDGRAEFAKDTKFQLLHFDADNLAETLTADMIGPMMRMNFPDYDFQMRFEFVVPDPDAANKLQAVQTAVSMGAKAKVSQVQELAGIEKPEADDETIGGLDQLYASHGEMKCLTPRTGSAINPETQQTDDGAVDRQRDGGFDDTEEPLKLIGGQDFEEFGEFNSHGLYREKIQADDWKPTKSGKGEYSSSAGYWRPKGSTKSERHNMTHEVGHRIGVSHASNLRAVLANHENGGWSADRARCEIDRFHDEAAGHEERSFKNRYARLKEQIGENHDKSVFKTPEWQAVKEAHRDGLNGVHDALKVMTDRANHLIDWKEKSGEVLTKRHASHVADAADVHREAHDEALNGIVAAMRAFVAVHGRGKGGAVHLQDEDDVELFAKKGTERKPQPFRTNKSGHIVPDLVGGGPPTVHQFRPGMQPPRQQQPPMAHPTNEPAEGVAERQANDWRPTRSGRGEYSPSTGQWRPVGSGGGSTQHVSSANHHASERNRHMRMMLDGLRKLRNHQAFANEARKHLRLGTLINGGKLETADLHDLRDELKEVSGKNPGHLGGFLKFLHENADAAVHHHESAAEAKFHHLTAASSAKPKDAGGGIPEHPETSNQKPAKTESENPFGPHSNLGQQAERQAKLEGMNVNHVHQLAKNYHETTGMHPAAAYRAAIDNFRLGRSTWGGAKAAEPKQAGKAPPPPRPPEAGGKPRDKSPGIYEPEWVGQQKAEPRQETQQTGKPKNIGAIRGKWNMEAMKAGIDPYSLHNRAGTYSNGGMDHEAAYKRAFDELSKKPGHDKPDVDSGDGIFDPANKPAEAADLDEILKPRQPEERQPGWDDDKPASPKGKSKSHVDNANEILRQHADMIRDNHNDDADEHNSILREVEEELARRWIEKPHENIHPTTLRKMMANGRADASSIPGLDEIAASLAERFPHRLKKSVDSAGHDNSFDLDDQLFQMMQEGRKKRMTRDEAEQKALDHLAQQSFDHGGSSSKKKDEDEEIPFGEVELIDLYSLVA